MCLLIITTKRSTSMTPEEDFGRSLNARLNLIEHILAVRTEKFVIRSYLVGKMLPSLFIHTLS